jgi:TM2 domain-containing membrane protein YozV
MHAVTRARTIEGDSIAAVLSLILPGAGQIYKGRTLAGIVWMLVTAWLYLTIFLPGVLVHFACVGEAYWRPARDR